MLYLTDRDNSLLNAMPPNSFGYEGTMAFFTSSNSINLTMTEIAIYDVNTNAKVMVTNDFYRNLKKNGYMQYWATNPIISGSGGDVFSTDVLELKTEEYLKSLGILAGDYRVTYKFYINTVGNENTNSQLFVKTISPQRKEVELDYLEDKLSPPYDAFGKSFFYKNKRNYTFDNILNFGNDVVSLLLNARNQINSDGSNSLIVKLYDALPDSIVEKSPCWISSLISDVYEDFVTLVQPEKNPLIGVALLADPDFSINISANTSEYIPYSNFTQLMSEGENLIQNQYSNTVSGSDLYGIELYIDYGKRENYIHFGSAKSMLTNFYNKMSALEFCNHQMSINTSSLSFASTSSMYWQNKALEVLGSFTRYENFLYYSYTGSFYTSSIDDTTILDAIWPKSGSSYPYVLYSTASGVLQDWYSTASAESSHYDEIVNSNYLYKLLPEYIQIDSDSNADYITFINMVGEFFDNIWTYIQYFYKIQNRDENKYNSAPMELMWNILRNTGLNVNEGNDLVNVAQYYYGIYGTPTSSADIQQSNNLITKEIWNRLLNNYVALYKSRGTENSIYSLLNCYGIPNNLLTIREFGGASQDTSNAGRDFIIEDFTHVVNFEGTQQVAIPWVASSKFNRFPDGIEFKFRTVGTSSQEIFCTDGFWSTDAFPYSMSLVLSRKNSSGNLGQLSLNFIPPDIGTILTLTSSYLPFYDRDFYNVMVKREQPSDNVSITNQTYSLWINKYDELLNKVTVEYTASVSSELYIPYIIPPYNRAWTASGSLYFGGHPSSSHKFVGSIDEIRLWAENISYDVFTWHSQYSVATNGNDTTSSLNTLLVRLPFNVAYNLGVTHSIDNMAFDVGYAPVISASGFRNEPTYSYSFSYYERSSTATNNFLTPAMDNDNKIRIINNYLSQSVLLNTARIYPLSVPNGSKYDNVILDQSVNNFVTIAGEYVDDTYTLDSDKLLVGFSVASLINNDILAFYGNGNFMDILGDPIYLHSNYYPPMRTLKLTYQDNTKNGINVYDYLKYINYYDKSVYQQIRNLLPVQANSAVGLIYEQTLLERNRFNLVNEFGNNFAQKNAEIPDPGMPLKGNNEFISHEVITSNFFASGKDEAESGESQYHFNARKVKYVTPSALSEMAKLVVFPNKNKGTLNTSLTTSDGESVVQVFKNDPMRLKVNSSDNPKLDVVSSTTVPQISVNSVINSAPPPPVS